MEIASTADLVAASTIGNTALESAELKAHETAIEVNIEIIEVKPMAKVTFGENVE